MRNDLAANALIPRTAIAPAAARGRLRTGSRSLGVDIVAGYKNVTEMVEECWKRGWFVCVLD